MYIRILYTHTVGLLLPPAVLVLSASVDDTMLSGSCFFAQARTSSSCDDLISMPNTLHTGKRRSYSTAIAQVFLRARVGQILPSKCAKKGHQNPQPWTLPTSDLRENMRRGAAISCLYLPETSRHGSKTLCEFVRFQRVLQLGCEDDSGDASRQLRGQLCICMSFEHRARALSLGRTRQTFKETSVKNKLGARKVSGAP